MRRITTLAIGAFAAVSLLAACGGDDSSNGGAVSDEEFCTMIQNYKDKADSFDSAFNSDDPKDIETAFTTMQGILHDLDDAAPSGVKEDLGTMVGVIDRMIEIFDQYDWDFTKLAMAPEFEELSTQLDGDEMNAASDRLDQYSEEVCGIESGS